MSSGARDRGCPSGAGVSEGVGVLRWVSPRAWGLLPGAPATRTGLTPAGTVQHATASSPLAEALRAVFSQPGLVMARVLAEEESAAPGKIQLRILCATICLIFTPVLWVFGLLRTSDWIVGEIVCIIKNALRFSHRFFTPTLFVRCLYQ